MERIWNVLIFKTVFNLRLNIAPSIDYHWFARSTNITSVAFFFRSTNIKLQVLLFLDLDLQNYKCCFFKIYQHYKVCFFLVY